ncbi:MAG TPA: hypothetical protein VL866_23455 [Pyrinomonadaceae bacterium]|nr:hypothetical protein [Pyrinomonadaceae bacterium]
MMDEIDTFVELKRTFQQHRLGVLLQVELTAHPAFPKEGADFIVTQPSLGAQRHLSIPGPRES